MIKTNKRRQLGLSRIVVVMMTIKWLTNDDDENDCHDKGSYEGGVNSDYDDNDNDDGYNRDDDHEDENHKKSVGTRELITNLVEIHIFNMDLPSTRRHSFCDLLNHLTTTQAVLVLP